MKMNIFILKNIGYRLIYFSILWYRITMRWTLKRGVALKKYKELQDIPQAFNYGRRYRYDEMIILGRDGDHLTHPTLLQDRLNKKEPFGDCDDHAIYWCVSLLKSKLASKVWFAIYHMEDKENKKMVGHAVCVFADEENNLYWADYRVPEKIESAKDFMIRSAERYGRSAIVGALCHVKSIDKNGTPKFGKITRLLP